MRAFVVTPPVPIVTWAEADKHLNLSGDTTLQSEVEAMISAATATIDGPGGYLGRALGVQTIEARFDTFGCGALRLPCPPHIAITSVKYLDANNVEQTISPSVYELIDRTLMPAHNATWPTPLWRRECIRVRYQAGYNAGTTGPVPPNAKHAILLMIGDMYRFRETATTGNASAVPMSTTVERLLAGLQVYD